MTCPAPDKKRKRQIGVHSPPFSAVGEAEGQTLLHSTLPPTIFLSPFESLSGQAWAVKNPFGLRCPFAPRFRPVFVLLLFVFLFFSSKEETFQHPRHIMSSSSPPLQVERKKRSQNSSFSGVFFFLLLLNNLRTGRRKKKKTEKRKVLGLVFS